MSRITAINVLLLIAAVVLALALFIAGAVWRGRVMHGGVVHRPPDQPHFSAECLGTARGQLSSIKVGNDSEVRIGRGDWI